MAKDSTRGIWGAYRRSQKIQGAKKAATPNPVPTPKPKGKKAPRSTQGSS